MVRLGVCRLSGREEFMHRATGTRHVDHEHPEQVLCQPLVLVKKLDVEDVARMLPIKCRMEFATIQIVECDNLHLDEPKLLRDRVRCLHDLGRTHCTAGDRRGLDLYLSTAATY